ncbi:hypothetical protein [Dyella acidiphila]|uniref:Uncharacterized protein n=1 Tax=Dyella acidiphila TaxID=2775866 RepID=A0ABR9G5D8_9GAMM|nr:hypothetical protein [Dyella acidiphila]MBE1159250.1 hypothetical protein [Dyella acidiphila]
MHLELPKASLESGKDFLKHYLMIVLSILTALGLEAWIEHAHHQHAAQVASAQIDAEIRANLAEIHIALTEDTEHAQTFARIRDGLEQDLRANTPEATIEQHILAQTGDGNFNLNLRWPTLRQEAWDVAVANQSVSWLDDERMRRYSAAYSAQRDVVNSLSANLGLVMNGPRMIDTATDLRSGHVDPREFLHVIAQMALMLRQAKDNLGTLQQRLQDALPEEKH